MNIAFNDIGATLLSNALLVVPLAVLAAVLCRVVKRPAVAWCLWGLVLLKFVTPAWYEFAQTPRADAFFETAPRKHPVSQLAGPEASDLSRSDGRSAEGLSRHRVSAPQNSQPPDVSIGQSSGGRVRSEADGRVSRSTENIGPGLPDGQTRPPGATLTGGQQEFPLSPVARADLPQSVAGGEGRGEGQPSTVERANTDDGDPVPSSALAHVAPVREGEAPAEPQAPTRADAPRISNIEPDDSVTMAAPVARRSGVIEAAPRGSAGVSPSQAESSPVQMTPDRPRLRRAGLPDSQAETSPVQITPARAVPLVPVLIAVWALGTVALIALAVVRVRRFRRLLKHARPAPETIAAQAHALAARLGIRRPPDLRITPARVPPLLWGAGRRAVILLPSGLLDELDGDQQQALLAHELAHFVRRDHWTRWFELAVRSVYWWHPVAWWAGRRLREAEEQCCDAWVVRLLPGSHRRYADALLKTVDFLAADPRPVPSLATGITSVRRSLRPFHRRLTMIIEHRPSPRLTWPARLCLLALAGVVLPASIAAVGEDEPIEESKPAATSKAALEAGAADEGSAESRLRVLPNNEMLEVWPLSGFINPMAVIERIEEHYAKSLSHPSIKKVNLADGNFGIVVRGSEEQLETVRQIIADIPRGWRAASSATTKARSHEGDADHDAAAEDGRLVADTKSRHEDQHVTIPLSWFGDSAEAIMRFVEQLANIENAPSVKFQNNELRVSGTEEQMQAVRDILAAPDEEEPAVADRTPPSTPDRLLVERGSYPLDPLGPDDEAAERNLVVPHGVSLTETIKSIEEHFADSEEKPTVSGFNIWTPRDPISNYTNIVTVRGTLAQYEAVKAFVSAMDTMHGDKVTVVRARYVLPKGVAEALDQFIQQHGGQFEFLMSSTAEGGMPLSSLGGFGGSLGGLAGRRGAPGKNTDEFGLEDDFGGGGDMTSLGLDPSMLSMMGVAGGLAGMGGMMGFATNNVSTLTVIGTPEVQQQFGEFIKALMPAKSAEPSASIEKTKLNAADLSQLLGASYQPSQYDEKSENRTNVFGAAGALKKSAADSGGPETLTLVRVRYKLPRAAIRGLEDMMMLSGAAGGDMAALAMMGAPQPSIGDGVFNLLTAVKESNLVPLLLVSRDGDQLIVTTTEDFQQHLGEFIRFLQQHQPVATGEARNRDGVVKDYVEKQIGSTAKHKATFYLARSRQALKAGNLDEARNQVQSAAALNVRYDLFEDRPELVLADIAKAEAAAGKATTIEGQGHGVLPTEPKWMQNILLSPKARSNRQAARDAAALRKTERELTVLIDMAEEAIKNGGNRVAVLLAINQFYGDNATSDALVEVFNKLTDLETKQEDMVRTHGKQHPEVVGLQMQIETLRRSFGLPTGDDAKSADVLDIYLQALKHQRAATRKLLEAPEQPEGDDPYQGTEKKGQP